MGDQLTRDRLIRDSIDAVRELSRDLDLSAMVDRDAVQLQARTQVFCTLTTCRRIDISATKIMNAIEGLDLNVDLDVYVIATKLEGLRSSLTMLHEGLISALRDLKIIEPS
jgi:hypothetical protein